MKQLTYLNAIHHFVHGNWNIEPENIRKFLIFDSIRKKYPARLIKSYNSIRNIKNPNKRQVVVFYDLTRLLTHNGYSGISLTVWKIFELLSNVDAIKLIPIFDNEYFQAEAKKIKVKYLNHSPIDAFEYRLVEREYRGAERIHHSTYYPLPDDLEPDIKKVIMLYDIIHLTEKKHYPDPSKFVTERIAKSCRNADTVLAISKYSADELGKYLNYKPQTVITPLASTLRSEGFIKQELDNGSFNTLTFAYQGGDPRKNFTGMLEIAKAWLERNERNNVSIFGNLHNLREKHGAHPVISSNRTSLYNKPNDQELVNIYKESAIYLYLSEAEGFGLPPLEAMSCGCPSVILDNSSLSEVFLGWEGLLKSEYSKERVLEKVDDLLGTKGIRKRAMQFSSNYCWDVTIEFVLSGYSAALK